MRHLWSLIAGLAAAPLAWVLLALGQDGSVRTIGGWEERGVYDTADLIGPAAYLAVAAVLLGLIATLRVSPLGPLAAGLLLLTAYGLMFVNPFRVHDGLPAGRSVLGEPLRLAVPLDNGTLGLLGAVLVMAVFSGQRWRRWPAAGPADGSADGSADIAPASAAADAEPADAEPAGAEPAGAEPADVPAGRRVGSPVEEPVDSPIWRPAGTPPAVSAGEPERAALPAGPATGRLTAAPEAGAATADAGTGAAGEHGPPDDATRTTPPDWPPPAESPLAASGAAPAADKPRDGAGADGAPVVRARPDAGATAEPEPAIPSEPDVAAEPEPAIPSEPEVAAEPEPTTPSEPEVAAEREATEDVPPPRRRPAPRPRPPAPGDAMAGRSPWAAPPSAAGKRDSSPE